MSRGDGELSRAASRQPWGSRCLGWAAGSAWRGRGAQRPRTPLPGLQRPLADSGGSGPAVGSERSVLEQTHACHDSSHPRPAWTLSPSLESGQTRVGLTVSTTRKEPQASPSRGLAWASAPGKCDPRLPCEVSAPVCWRLCQLSGTQRPLQSNFWGDAGHFPWPHTSRGVSICPLISDTWSPSWLRW